MTTAIHRTTDIYLASFLISQGQEFVGCERLRPKVNEFQFVAGEKLHDLMRFYWSGAPVYLVPSRLLTSLRKLKNLAIAEERQRRYESWCAALVGEESAGRRGRFSFHFSLMRAELPQDRHIPDSEPGNRFTALATALVGYLDEIDEYRNICMQHEAAVAVSVSGDVLHLARFFPWEERTTGYLRGAVGRLPGWATSPFWKADRQTWAKITAGGTKRKCRSAPKQPIIARGISWEGRPVFARASHIRGKELLLVELLLLPLGTKLPEIPLRSVAHGLLCHAALLPPWVARPLPYSPAHQAGSCTLRQYLMRAMPQNLYASQCFWLPGAGK